jgi:hypothetical protein
MRGEKREMMRERKKEEKGTIMIRRENDIENERERERGSEMKEKDIGSD